MAARIPNWARWILFLPGGLLAFAITYDGAWLAAFLLSTAFVTVAGLPIGESAFVALPTGIGAYFFISCSAKIAPKNHFEVSIILAVTYVVLAGFVLTEQLVIFAKSDILPFDALPPWFTTVTAMIGGSIGAIVACLRFREKAKRGAVSKLSPRKSKNR